MKMGLELQFLQLLRVSEFLPTPSDHYIRGQDILGRGLNQWREESEELWMQSN